MMEAVRTSETSVDNNFTRQYIPEDNSEQQLHILFQISQSAYFDIYSRLLWYEFHTEILKRAVD